MTDTEQPSPWAVELLHSVVGDWRAHGSISAALELQRAFAEREADLVGALNVVRKQFPILGSRGAKIDLQLVEDHGKQAYENHYQTVTRLAERGGLSWSELHAVLHNRPWQKMDENTVIEECRALEARYLTALKSREAGHG